jgi:hypothetical protein
MTPVVATSGASRMATGPDGNRPDDNLAMPARRTVSAMQSAAMPSANASLATAIAVVP